MIPSSTATSSPLSAAAVVGRVLVLMLVAGFLGAARAQTTGLVPLNDLGTGLYKGFQGGLYPGGRNDPPAAHHDAAMRAAAEIVTRNAAGTPDAQGLIAMIAVGMSNTTHEFAVFERNEDADRLRNARLVLMDTAFGGQTAAAIANPSAAYWTTMAQRLTVMRISAAQVQVAWLKEADAQPPDNFPVHAETLRDELVAVVQNLHDRFPNLKICYLSSRIYGGYAAPGSLNPEPQAYESGFSAKWLIEDQIAGDPALNYGQLPGPVRAPLLLWGPYLWADGTNPRSDGLTWLASDLEADFTHPGPTGEQKVAGMLSAFFSRASTAVGWWPAASDVGLVVVGAAKDAYTNAAAPSSNFGATTQLLAQGGASPITSYLGFDVASVPRPVTLAKLSLRVAQGAFGPVSTVANTSWTEAGITYANAPALGASLWNHPQASRDGTFAAEVTANVNGDTDGKLSYALTTTTSGQASYISREGGQPPRLVLTVACQGTSDADGDGRPDFCDCAPANGSAFAVAREVQNLRWLGPGLLGWDSEAALAGAGTVYDVMSGDLAELASPPGAPGEVCIASAIASGQAADPTATPGPGEGRYFLVRASNACGTSRWETSSEGSDRSVPSCP